VLNIIMLWVFAFVTWPNLSRSYGSAGQQLLQGVVMSEGYKSQYGAAKFVGALTSFVGWVVLVLGVVGAIVGVSMAINLATAQDVDPARQMSIAVAAAGSVFSLQFTLIGLLLAGLGQHFRATADNANHSGEMLALMKSGKA